MRKAKRQLLKQQVNALNSLYSICRTTAKPWNVNHIPLNTFKNICDLGKIKPKTDEKSILALSQAFNNMIDSIYKGAEAECKEHATKHVPLVVIKQMIDVTIQGLKEGAKQQ